MIKDKDNNNTRKVLQALWKSARSTFVEIEKIERYIISDISLDFFE